MDSLADIREAVGAHQMERARILASQYVFAHPGEFHQFRDLSLDDCVQAVDRLRAEGRERELWRVEAWLLHTHAPQDITGAINKQLDLEELLEGHV